MLRTQGALILALLAACGGDSKPRQATGAPEPVSPVTDPAAAPEPPAEPEPPAPALTAHAIDSLGAPLVIELPAGFEATEATADYARFVGPDFQILVELPAEGASLRDERAFVKTPKATAFVDETWDGGEAIAYRAGDTIAAVVAYETLGVLCSGAGLDGEDEARAVIAGCRTLRPATP